MEVTIGRRNLKNFHERSAELLTVGLGLAAGAGGDALGLPGGWLVGALCVSAAASLAGLPLAFPRWLLWALPVYIGVNVGSALEPEHLTQMAGWVPSLVGLLISLSLSLLTLPRLLRVIARLPRTTAFFAAYPGHLVLVIAEASDRALNLGQITSIQMVRLVILVAVLPLLVTRLEPSSTELVPAGIKWVAALWVLGAGLLGLLVAGWLRMPGGRIVGPMIGAATASLLGIDMGELPVTVEHLTLGLVGTMIGTRLIGMRAQTAAGLLPAGIAAVTVSVVIAVIVALPVAWWTGFPMTTLILAYAPGGADVMSMLALVLGQDAAFVGFHHVFRLTVMALALPWLIRLLAGSSGN